MDLNFIKKQKNELIFWIGFWFLQSLLMSNGEYLQFYLMKNIAIVGLQAVVVYVNLKWLFPFLFDKGKYLHYILSSAFLIYLVFTFSFFFIDLALSFTGVPVNSLEIRFSADFWRILSGSSFYSLALVCSTIYKLWRMNKEKELITTDLLNQKKNSEKKYHDLKRQLKSNHITIKEGNKFHLILTNDIYYIKGLKEYVVWHTNTKKIITLESLSNIEEKYNALGFMRIHKSYIININNVSSVTSSSVKVNNEILPIGRTYKKSMNQLFLK